MFQIYMQYEDCQVFYKLAYIGSPILVRTETRRLKFSDAPNYIIGLKITTVPLCFQLSSLSSFLHGTVHQQCIHLFSCTIKQTQAT